MERGADIAPEFFKVILPSPTLRHKIELNKDFVRHYGNQLRNNVSLNDCAGGIWPVELEKVDDSLWLHNGWDKFYHDHAIEYGYFIVFKYEGRSTFKVTIFDLNATKVHYPLGNSIPSGGLRADGSNRNVVHTEGTSTHGYPSFEVTMKENLNARCVVFVPAQFAREYLPNFSGHKIEIHDSDGAKWRIDINMRDGLLRYFRWGDYTEAKGIDSGDTCKFELIGSDNPVAFKVSKLGKMTDEFVPI